MNEFEIALANAMLLQLLHFIWYVKNDKKIAKTWFSVLVPQLHFMLNQGLNFCLQGKKLLNMT